MASSRSIRVVNIIKRPTLNQCECRDIIHDFKARYSMSPQSRKNILIYSHFDEECDRCSVTPKYLRWNLSFQQLFPARSIKCWSINRVPIWNNSDLGWFVVALYVVILFIDIKSIETQRLRALILVNMTTTTEHSWCDVQVRTMNKLVNEIISRLNGWFWIERIYWELISLTAGTAGTKQAMNNKSSSQMTPTNVESTKVLHKSPISAN